MIIEAISPGRKVDSRDRVGRLVLRSTNDVEADFLAQLANALDSGQPVDLPAIKKVFQIRPQAQQEATR